MNFFFVWFPYGSEIFARGCFIMPNKLWFYEPSRNDEFYEAESVRS
jgi:hypothetical protein